MGGSEIGENFLKNWQKKGGPYFGHFLEILGISGENGVKSWPPKESKSAEKTVHHPSGGSEVLPRVDLGLRHAGSAKSTLGRTSEITPKGRGAVFSADLDSLGGQDCTLFSPEIPKISKKCPK